MSSSSSRASAVEASRTSSRTRRRQPDALPEIPPPANKKARVSTQSTSKKDTFKSKETSAAVPAKKTRKAKEETTHPDESNVEKAATSASGDDGKVRCSWALKHPAELEYHDNEWGPASHPAGGMSDRLIFEFLILESAQAGLSWLTILKKREAYRKAFVGFDFDKVATFGSKDIERLLKSEGTKPEEVIVRNRAKIEATVQAAKLFRSSILKEWVLMIAVIHLMVGLTRFRPLFIATRAHTATLPPFSPRASPSSTPRDQKWASAPRLPSLMPSVPI